MASDNLNQIGNLIGKTGRDADRSLKRTVPIRPRLERVRDVFDSTVQFEMSFEKTQDDTRVLLDLFFNLPPPIRGCKVGCIITKCEDFDYTSGDHSVTVKNPYLPGTVSVYIDGDKLSASQIAETNPEGGEVFFQGPASYDAVSICYIYITDDCTTDVSNECLFDFKPSFIGAELAFCDRFDRAPTVEPFCGLGFWYGTFGSPLTGPALPVKVVGGEAVFNDSFAGQRYVFENAQGANVISETVMVMDCRGWDQTTGSGASAFSFSLNNVAGFNIGVVISGPTHVLTLTRPFKYTPTNSPGSSWALRNQVQTFAIPLSTADMKNYIVCRLFVLPGSVQFKMWPLGQPEPTSWIQHTIPPDTTPLGVGPWTTSYEDTDFIGCFSVGTSNPTKGGLLAIQHWIGRNQVFGYWNRETQERLPGYSWVRTNPMPQENIDYINAHPNVYFQAGDYGTTQTLTQFQAAPSNLAGGQPNHIYSYVTPFFGGPTIEAADQRNLFSGSAHYAFSYDTTLGKPTTYKIRGQVQWYQTSASRGIIPHMTVQLQAMSYGDQTPNTDDTTIHGEVKQTLLMPFSATQSTELPGASDSYSGWRSASDWTDFEIEVPCSGGHHVQWGVKFQDDPMQVQEWLSYLAVDSILRSTSVQIRFRGIFQEAIMNPLTNNADICDVGPLSSRCTQIIESFDVPYVGNTECYDSTAFHSDQYISADAKWSMYYRRGVVQPNINNNKIRIDFKARSDRFASDISGTTGDGRCPRDPFSSNQPSVIGGTSRTSESFSMFTTGSNTSIPTINSLNDSPAVCGWFDYSAKFKFNIPGPWLATTGSSNFTLTPTMTLNFATYTGSEAAGNFGTIVSPYVSLTKGSTNTLIVNPNGGINFSWINNTEYNLYAQFRDHLYVKVWPVGTTEPSAWMVQAPFDITLLGPAIGFAITLSDYSTDDAYLEVRDIQVVSVDR